MIFEKIQKTLDKTVIKHLHNRVSIGNQEVRAKIYNLEDVIDYQTGESCSRLGCRIYCSELEKTGLPASSNLLMNSIVTFKGKNYEVVKISDYKDYKVLTLRG